MKKQKKQEKPAGLNPLTAKVKKAKSVKAPKVYEIVSAKKGNTIVFNWILADISLEEAKRKPWFYTIL
ncbi:MAG: hypothetical protein Q8O74_03615, partial [bacterium]|nr:hypothetical protein [bacterium]